MDWLAHCQRSLKHEQMEFLPGAATLQQRVARLRGACGNRGPTDSLASIFSATFQGACVAAFPGSSKSESGVGPLIRMLRNAPAQPGFGQDELENGMLCLFRNRDPGCPIRLGKVLRVVREGSSDPYVVCESWWPILKPEKHGGRMNLFGAWVPCKQPLTEGPSKKKVAAAHGVGQLMVQISDVFVWPIELDPSDSWPSGGHIPYAAFHYLRSVHGVDLAGPSFTFSKRGKAFFMEVAKLLAKHIHQEQAGKS